jgi:uracil-DNA glycosylase
MHFKDWKDFKAQVIACEKCSRLRKHCTKIANEKRKAYANQEYWGRPIPSFGDLNARLILIGLAPAAHGANRTGRMFTGDRSGEWLYRALYKAGFANQPTSEHIKDGLTLNDVYITASVRCAPPGNKPSPIEMKNCFPYLEYEFKNLKNARVFLALGKTGFDQTWNSLKLMNEAEGPRPAFGHNTCIKLKSGRYLLGSYHPSQQNTFTGKLTEPMFDAVFNRAKELL